MDINRRMVLSGIATGTVIGLAGCLGPDVETVDSLPAPRKGIENAPAQILLFEDFACPACKSFNDQLLPQLEADFIDTEQANLFFYDYPVPAGRLSWEAAMAARAVQDTSGVDDFWTYAKFLYQNQSQLSWKLLEAAADEIGLDGEGIVLAARDGVYRPVVRASRQEGKSRGVSSTPSVFVNGQYIQPPTTGTYADYYSSIASAIRNAQ